MKSLCLRPRIVACLLAILAFNRAQTITIGTVSATSGNWNSSSTWVGGIVPSSGDNVIIASGHTVTIDVSSYCANITINGTLQFPDVTTYLNLNVYGDFTVAASGTVLAAPSNSNFGYGNFNLYGNLQVLGTYTPVISGGRSIFIYMYTGGKSIDASGKDLSALVISVPGSSITVSSSFTLSSRLALGDGTLDNSAHNITIGPDVTIDRNTQTAVLAVAPVFSGTNQTCRYSESMTTGYEVPDAFNKLSVGIFGSGSVTLNKDVSVSYLEFDGTDNHLITGSHTITVTASVDRVDNTPYVIGNLALSFNSAPLSRTYPVGTASAFRPVTVNVSSITGSGTITVSQTDVAPASNSLPSGVTGISQKGYCTVSKSAGISAATADVTLGWEADDGVVSPASVVVAHGDHATGVWDVANCSGGHTGTATSGTVTGCGFTSMSDFTLGTTTSDNVLAVVATSFAATPERGSVVITWQTAQEVNNLGFNIYRRELGSSYRLLAGYSDREGLRGTGTSSTPKNYRFTDSNVKPGVTYEYKIESVAADGASKVLSLLTVKVDVPMEFALRQNYPNPFNPSTTIRYSLPQRSHVLISVYNLLGQRIIDLENTEKDAGNYETRFAAPGLASGQYVCRMEASSTAGANVHYVDVKKMTLMK